MTNKFAGLGTKLCAENVPVAPPEYCTLNNTSCQLLRIEIQTDKKCTGCVSKSSKTTKMYDVIQENIIQFTTNYTFILVLKYRLILLLYSIGIFDWQRN